MIVPNINPYFLPIFFIKRDAGRPDNIVPIRWKERGKVANDLLLEISNPMIEDAETVKLLVLAERAKQIARGKIFCKFFEKKNFI